jgi:hypothetical protein
MFLQRIYDFVFYIREKIFGIGCSKSYLHVSDDDYGNGGVNENETQCVVFFDCENGMMYNKL